MKSIESIIERQAYVRRLRDECMVKEVHYGEIGAAGSGKRALLLPGAQLLANAFGYSAEKAISRIELANGHVTYVARAILTCPEGRYEGVGEGSTLEDKYRYRYEYIDAPIPKAYWDTRDQSLLLPNCIVRKGKGGQWMQARVFESEPANHYNTVCKMAAKRAFTDAVIQAVGCADIFTQDEDYIQQQRDTGERADAPPLPPAPERQNQPASRRQPPAQSQANDGAVRVSGVKLLKKGENRNGPWSLWKIDTTDGRSGTTFDESVAEAAQALMAEQAPVVAEWFDSGKPDNRGNPQYTCKSVSRVAEAGKPPPNRHEALIESVEAKQVPAGARPVWSVATDIGRLGTLDAQIASALAEAAGTGRLLILHVCDTPRGGEIVRIEEPGPTDQQEPADDIPF